ncbi:SET and MYND domain-containing protein 4 [Condylostylus longicornis]|uniref:SET and MYND domain-containing protein 4 n=1 Tax=Condylostylus longicornis TaxID=2530218 RepID=UPI00244E56AA|nr:SET and MYND domain-containing protein 4 [Condylostylus longicornis]XP_055372441.1 SET and MYND domain-containing protein 4 [Condylostylus longicornis]
MSSNSRKQDVYDIYEALVKALKKINKINSYSKEFSEIRENYEKVNSVEELLVKYQFIERIGLKVTLRLEKSNEKSIAFRKEGNEYFSLEKQNYFKALELYNKSICFAQPNSENISIGYANRSAVLFEWKRYKECLYNIELARKYNYPERLIHKLNKREANCRALLNNQVSNTKPYDFKLSFEKHPQVPFIADCLDLQYTKEAGRYIISKKDLSPGDLVSIEKAFCSVLLPPMRYIRCANCKEENYFTLIPCVECTSAMFCSEKCQIEANKEFHQFECPIIDMLNNIFNKIHWTALRVTLTALTLFENIDECISFCRNPQNLSQCSFTLDYSNFDRKEYYKAIHGLVTNQCKRTLDDLFQRSVIAAVLKNFLLNHSPLKDYLGGNEGENVFVELLFRHLQTSPSNMHSVDLIEQKNETNDDQCFASAAYGFGSLLNHSCAPNTVRIYKGTTTYLFILRPIKANETLYDNYGYHYATKRRELRQKKLETQYRFKCSCEACKYDYPLFEKLPVPTEVPDEVEYDDITSLMSYDFQYALSNYKRYYEFLNRFSKYYPCAQISAAEESLKMALNILVDAVPLKAKRNC